MLNNKKAPIVRPGRFRFQSSELCSLVYYVRYVNIGLINFKKISRTYFICRD
nr:MAG TPA: hypothetical protein [Caudoviricetes sp.]